MEITDFSLQFDVLYNNITSNRAPGLNEYEKSVFLTKAQNELVKNYFLPQSNLKQAGFDDNRRRQADFSNLIENISLVPSSGSTDSKIDKRSNSLLFELVNGGSPLRVVAIVNESFTSTKNDETKLYTVVPMSLVEYSRAMKKPYNEPYKGQVWRLITKAGLANSTYTTTIEIVRRTVDIEDGATLRYNLTYVRFPEEIKLYSTNPITGDTVPTQPCELDESLHEEVLQRAVELAKVAWQGDLNSSIEMGKRSE